MRQALKILLPVLSVFCARAQMPDTDLWLFRLEKDKVQQRLFPDKPVNITNRPGYDNQPSFSLDGKIIYYVSVRDDKQADIYRYETGSKKILQVTHSKESEYSPVVQGNMLLTSVVVEADSAQRIHFIQPEKGFFEKKLEPDSVGYYTFLNSDTLLYYKLTEPHSLRYHVLKTGEDKWMGNSPARTFGVINRHTVIYGLKDSSKVTFYKYDFLLHRAEKYCEYPSLNEDVFWHHDLGLMKSENARIFVYRAYKKQWELLYDLSLFGIKKITRFAFDRQNKYLVVVHNL